MGNQLFSNWSASKRPLCLNIIKTRYTPYWRIREKACLFLP